MNQKPSATFKITVVFKEKCEIEIKIYENTGVALCRVNEVVEPQVFVKSWVDNNKIKLCTI